MRGPGNGTIDRVGSLAELANFAAAETNNLEGLVKCAEDRYEALTGKPISDPEGGGRPEVPPAAPTIEVRYDQGSHIGQTWEQLQRINRLQRRLGYVLDCIGGAL